MRRPLPKVSAFSWITCFCVVANAAPQIVVPFTFFGQLAGRPFVGIKTDRFCETSQALSSWCQVQVSSNDTSTEEEISSTRTFCVKANMKVATGRVESNPC